MSDCGHIHWEAGCATCTSTEEGLRVRIADLEAQLVDRETQLADAARAIREGEALAHRLLQSQVPPELLERFAAILDQAAAHSTWLYELGVVAPVIRSAAEAARGTKGGSGGV